MDEVRTCGDEPIGPSVFGASRYQNSKENRERGGKEQYKERKILD